MLKYSIYVLNRRITFHRIFPENRNLYTFQQCVNFVGDLTFRSQQYAGLKVRRISAVSYLNIMLCSVLNSYGSQYYNHCKINLA
jgi:hypothetical protein